MPQEVDRLVKPATAKAQKILDESNRALGEARGFFDDLARKGDKDMSHKRDPVSYRVARLVGHAGREATQNVQKVLVPTAITWDELKIFRDSLSGLTRSLRDIRTKTSAQLSGFYILDMRSFSGVTERVGKQSERLSQFLEGDGSSLQKARTLASILSDSRAVSGEIVERRSEEEELLHKREVLLSRSSFLDREIETLETQSVLKELLEVEKNLRSESRYFRTASLAHLKRPLRRLRDLSERGDAPLSLDEKEALGSFIQSPYRSFLSKRYGDFLISILENLRKALVSGKMGFKPKKTTRVLAQVQQLTSADELSSRQARGRTLLTRRRELLHDPDCKRLYDSRKEMLEELMKTKGEIEDVQEKQLALAQKLKTLDDRVRELFSLLEQRTREYTGKEVTIEGPSPAHPAN
jgi:hypothetical protein